MPIPGDFYQSSTVQTFDETITTRIASDPIPDVGLDLELQEADLVADTFFPDASFITAGTPFLQLPLLDFFGTNAQVLSTLAITMLHAGDSVRAHYARPAAGGVRLDIFGFWRSKLPPPPPPLGAWCEPFPPTDADTADQLEEIHMGRMAELADGF